MTGHASSGNAEPYGRTKSCAEFKRSLSPALEANWALGNACCSRGSGAGAESVAGKPVSRKITVPDCADAVLNPSRRTVKRGNLRFILASGVQILINGGFRVHARDSAPASSPLRGWSIARIPPRAWALGCNLTPLRG